MTTKEKEECKCPICGQPILQKRAWVYYKSTKTYVHRGSCEDEYERRLKVK